MAPTRTRAPMTVNPDQERPVHVPRAPAGLPRLAPTSTARAVFLLFGVAACGQAADRPAAESHDFTAVAAQVEAAVWAFHAADTARDAEAVIRLLWPEYTMLADGVRQGYDQVAAGSREFMAGLSLFHTVWRDLQVTPLGENAAIASFQFQDSIVTKAGDLIRNRGTTTFVWQRRNGKWRVLFADANHHPISAEAP